MTSLAVDLVRPPRSLAIELVRDPVWEARPGDVWLFTRRSLFNRLIVAKTWSPYTHVEVVGDVQYGHAAEMTGGVLLLAARVGGGCDVYTANLDGLALVLRPSVPFDQRAALAWWMREAVGQAYDWFGLFNFWYARLVGSKNRRMFCSEAATRVLRRGGVPVFPEHDADRVAPGEFLKQTLLPVWWRSPAELARFRAWQARGGFEGAP